MAIKHATTKTPGQKVFAVADWNANHTFLQTDIDHNQITNTHNLTNDIDHNLLTNYAANRHFLESEISHINILNIGTNTHAQIDTHIADTTNPHSVSYTQTGGQEILPIGTVLMYNGTGIANVSARSVQLGDDGGDTITLTGWYVCNGNASTPNLFNKFIRAETASGNTGGSDDAIVVTHTHTNSVGNQSASHNHIFTGGAMGNHGHTDTFAFAGSAMGNHGHADNFTTGNQSASHTHSHTHGNKTSGAPSAWTHIHKVDITSETQSASHYHTHDHANKVTTLNSVDHSHTFTGNAMGNHNHTATTGNADQPGGSSWGYRSATTPGDTSLVEAASAGTPAGTIGDQSANHNHWVNLPSINSGTQSASHTHWVNGSATTIGLGSALSTHTHTTNIGAKTSDTQSASHTHTINGAVTAASAGTPAGSITGAVTAASAGTPAGTLGNQSASHNHIVTIDNAGSSGTNANIPAYYSLIFIIKMS